MNRENQELPPQAKLMDMIWNCFVSQAISVAAKLNIADLLRDKPQSIATLAEQTGAHENSLYRLLRTLASVGVFAETDPKVFGLTPLAEPLLSDTAGSLRDVAIFMGADWHWSVFAELEHSVRTGEPAWKKVHGQEVFPYFQTHLAEYEIFNRAMTSFSSMVDPVVEAYDFENARTLVDIAGGHGLLLAKCLQANPQLNGILFDTPEVIAGAPELLKNEGLTERVKTVSGDFFENIPAGGDVYMMKHIIHDWDDERSIKILNNVALAMNTDSKILLIEQVIPEGNTPHQGKIIDLEMLVSPGGVERTADEYQELLAKSNLRLTRVIPTKSPLSIVEAIKTTE